MLMRLNRLAALCVAALLAAPAAAESDKPDISEETPAYTIEANLPKLPAGEPKLAHRLRAHLARQLKDYRKDAETAKKEAEAEKYEFRQYNLTVNWHVELDHPQFLSLINYTWIYSGGAHGNTNMETLIWDRKAQTAVPFNGLFANAGAAKRARTAMKAYAVKDLLRQKAKNLEVALEGFQDDQVVSGAASGLAIVTLEPSDQPGKISGIRLWYPPYAVGSYAEGSYESLVPHTVFSGFLRDELKPLFGGKSGRKAP